MSETLQLALVDAKRRHLTLVDSGVELIDRAESSSIDTNQAHDQPIIDSMANRINDTFCKRGSVLELSPMPRVNVAEFLRSLGKSALERYGNSSLVIHLDAVRSSPLATTTAARYVHEYKESNPIGFIFVEGTPGLSYDDLRTKDAMSEFCDTLDEGISPTLYMQPPAETKPAYIARTN